MIEVFKDIKGYPNYKVSNTGKVMSNRMNKLVWRILKPKDKGYLFQTLIDSKGEHKQFYIHRLVVEAFIGDIPEGYEVNHVDGSKDNNYVDNLEIVTPKENCAHRDKDGHQGELSVIIENTLTEEVKVYKTTTEAYIDLGITKSALKQRIHRGGIGIYLYSRGGAS